MKFTAWKALSPRDVTEQLATRATAKQRVAVTTFNGVEFRVSPAAKGDPVGLNSKIDEATKHYVDTKSLKPPL